jgi:hypothetical protein
MPNLTVTNDDEEYVLWRRYLKLRRAFDHSFALEKLTISKE